MSNKCPDPLCCTAAEPAPGYRGEGAPIPAVQTPVSPLRSEHDVLPQTGPVRHERTGPERSRHGPAAPVSGIPRYGPELGGGIYFRQKTKQNKNKHPNYSFLTLLRNHPDAELQTLWRA